MTFFVCRADYHGQEYCGDACRQRGCPAHHRASSARHQRSLGADGREDRRQQRLVRVAKELNQWR
jgi:hypothetical protein